MRVTENMRYQQVVRSLTDLNTRYAEASREAASGRRIAAPSDDPAAAAELVRVSASRAQVAVYRTAASGARSDLQAGEAALEQAGALFTQAREIAMQGGDGALSASERSALADRVAGIFEQVVSVANTRGSRGYLFAGTATNAPAFGADGAFAGNGWDQNVEVSPGQRIACNPSGERAFTPGGGRDVFSDLTALRTALANNDTAAISATLPGLEQAQHQIVRERAHCGLLLNRLDTTDQVLDSVDLDVERRDAAAGDADPYQSYTRLNQLSQALERSVTVARQLLSTGQNSGS